MLKRLAGFAAAIMVLGAAAARADSVTVREEGEWNVYNNVEVHQNQNSGRYYIKVTTQGRVISAMPEDVKDVVYEEDTWDPDGGQTGPAGPVEGNTGPLYAGAATFFVSAVTATEERLEINALVLRAGEQYMAFCTLDTAAVNQEFFNTVGSRLGTRRSKIMRENLMLSATRTETGAFNNDQGGIMRGVIEEVMFGEFSQELFDYAASRVTGAICAAEQNMRPATVRFATGKTSNLSKNTAISSDPVDETLTVAFFEGRDGSPLAYVVNWAAQPEIIRRHVKLGDEIPQSRDFIGPLATRLRDASGADDVPVLFINGAEGDVEPKTPGGTPEERIVHVGKGVAQTVLEIQDNGTPINEVTLTCQTRNVAMPPHLMKIFIPSETVLQEFWINDAVFLSMPGDVSSSIGMALRRKARDKGAQHVFLCGLTADYTGWHTDVKQFFESRDEATLSFYGPLVVSWYLDQHLPAAVIKASEPWEDSEMIRQHREVFERARQRARLNAETIRMRWEGLDSELTRKAGILRFLKPLPPEAEKILKKAPPEKAMDIGKQYAAYYVRYQQEFTDEEKTILTGVADGANLPFDAIALTQWLFEPSQIPDEAKPLLSSLNIEGMNFLDGTY